MQVHRCPSSPGGDGGPHSSSPPLRGRSFSPTQRPQSLHAIIHCVPVLMEAGTKRPADESGDGAAEKLQRLDEDGAAEDVVAIVPQRRTCLHEVRLLIEPAGPQLIPKKISH